MLIAILKWVFFETIIGSLVVGAVAYGIFWAIKRVFPKAPNPAIMAGPFLLLGILTVPSIPRYLFEQEVFDMTKGSPWIRITNQTKSGDLVAPLTLIKTPISSITMVMPHDPVSLGVFRKIVMRYDEEPMVFFVDPDCEDSTVWYSQPDDEGTVRYSTGKPQDMTEQERETYCAHDWAPEVEALRTEYLRLMDTEKQ